MDTHHTAQRAAEAKYDAGVSSDYSLNDFEDERFLCDGSEDEEVEPSDRWEREGRAEMYATLGVEMY